MGNGKGSSSSRRVQFLSSRKSKKGRVDLEQTLGPKGVRDFRAKAYADLQLKVAGEFCSFPCSSEENE